MVILFGTRMMIHGNYRNDRAKHNLLKYLFFCDPPITIACELAGNDEIIGSPLNVRRGQRYARSDDCSTPGATPPLIFATVATLGG